MKFNDFLSMAVSDSVNAYASGVREDAQSVSEGLSRDVRGECPDCGRHLTLTNKGNDGRCSNCTGRAWAEGASLPRTPERLRSWAGVTRNVIALAGQDFKPSDLADCEERIAAWEAEADALDLAQEERRTIRAAAAQADTHSSDVEPMVERLESKW